MIKRAKCPHQSLSSSMWLDIIQRYNTIIVTIFLNKEINQLYLAGTSRQRDLLAYALFVHHTLTYDPICTFSPKQKQVMTETFPTSTIPPLKAVRTTPGMCSCIAPLLTQSPFDLLQVLKIGCQHVLAIHVTNTPHIFANVQFFPSSTRCALLWVSQSFLYFPF
jgi:hypothetical protein